MRKDAGANTSIPYNQSKKSQNYHANIYIRLEQHCTPVTVIQRVENIPG